MFTIRLHILMYFPTVHFTFIEKSDGLVRDSKFEFHLPQFCFAQFIVILVWVSDFWFILLVMLINIVGMSEKQSISIEMVDFICLISLVLTIAGVLTEMLDDFVSMRKTLLELKGLR